MARYFLAHSVVKGGNNFGPEKKEESIKLVKEKQCIFNKKATIRECITGSVCVLKVKSMSSNSKWNNKINHVKVVKHTIKCCRSFRG